MRILVSGGTKTVRRLAQAYPDHLGHLMAPANGNNESIFGTGLPVGVDNGAYSGFCALAFRGLLRRIAGKPGILWVACPDVVGDAAATLGLFGEWEPEVRAAGFPVALVGQDGAERLCLPWCRFDCLFIGGSTRWKLSPEAALLAAAAKAYGKQVHMGRVNSLRRLRTAYDVGCDSVDGRQWSAWGDTWLEWGLRWVRRQERQKTLF